MMIYTKNLADDSESFMMTVLLMRCSEGRYKDATEVCNNGITDDTLNKSAKENENCTCDILTNELNNNVKNQI